MLCAAISGVLQRTRSAKVPFRKSQLFSLIAGKWCNAKRGHLQRESICRENNELAVTELPKRKRRLLPSRAIGHWRNLPSSSTYVPVRLPRGKRSLRAALPCVRSWWRPGCGAGDRRKVAARQDR